jgi:uncharacterized membrane protein
MTRLIALLTTLAALPLAACQSESSDPADPAQPAGAPEQIGDSAIPDPASTETYDGIEPDETLHFTGTEPFWGGEATGGTLRYSTPEDQDGTEIAVERFAGRGGLSFSGELNGAPFEMMVTPLECSDGMSDRTYPFTVTLEIGEETRNGCGWTDAKRFEGSERP